MPTKPSTPDKEYDIIGWTPEPVKVSGDAEYIATYKETIRRYTITFENYNGELLEETEVPYGTIPGYLGETPIKVADKDYTYAFIGWTPEIVPVVEDARYTATYTAVPIVKDEEVVSIKVKNAPTTVDYGKDLDLTKIILEVKDIDKTKIVVKELKTSGAEGRDVTKLAEITLQNNEVGKQKIVVTYGQWIEYIDIEIKTLQIRYSINDGPADIYDDNKEFEYGTKIGISWLAGSNVKATITGDNGTFDLVSGQVMPTNLECRYTIKIVGTNITKTFVIKPNTKIPPTVIANKLSTGEFEVTINGSKDLTNIKEITVYTKPNGGTGTMVKYSSEATEGTRPLEEFLNLKFDQHRCYYSITVTSIDGLSSDPCEFTVRIGISTKYLLL